MDTVQWGKGGWRDFAGSWAFTVTPCPGPKLTA